MASPTPERLQFLLHNPERIPAEMLSRGEISIWSILKQSIGKELSKITMPVVFNEPLSFLQRLSEYMEYSHLLIRASAEPDAVRRMELVAAFAVSALACNWDRVAKPFNPLLGETFELDRRESLGFRIMAEQVSHHPPVSAFHAEAPGHFEFHGSVYPKLKFWGPSIEIQPKGILTLTLHKHGETYTWHNVNCSVHNLVMGKTYIEQQGLMEITCHASGLKAQLNFKPSSAWFGSRDAANHVQGFVLDRKKKQLRALYGLWTEFLAACPVATLEQHVGQWGKRHREHRHRLEHQASVAALPDACANELPDSSFPVLAGSSVLWRAKPRPPNSHKYYNFTLYAMMLNEMREEEREKFPPTDCRLRPDIRAMEDGNWGYSSTLTSLCALVYGADLAASEKERLEEEQRERRKAKEKSDSLPRWFTASPHPILHKEDTWLSTATYWQRDFTNSQQLF